MSRSQTKLWSVGTLTYTSAGIAALFFWLLWGDFAWSMKDRAVGSVATLMVKSFGVSDFTYGLLILSFPNFTNAILGPLVSFRSDRHRGRFGRRIPFLAFTVPFIVAGMIGLAFTPWLGRELHGLIGADAISPNMACLLVFGFFWIMFDFGNTLASSIFTALVNDVVPVAFLGRFFGLFRAISLAAGVLFNFFFLGHAEAYSMWIFLGLAALYGTGFTMLLCKVKEGEYPPAEPAPRGAGSIPAIFRTYLKECFALPYYRWALLAVPVANMANVPFNAYTIFYAKSLNIGMDELGRYFAYTYIISFGLSYFLGMLADRFHPIRMGIASTAVYGVLAFCGTFLISGHLSFAIVFILHGVISGCFSTLTASFGPRLFPRKYFAQFNSAMWILQSFIWMILTPVTGRILDLIDHRYNYTLFIGGICSIFGVAILCVVYRGFLKLGGDRNYQAPDIETLHGQDGSPRP